MIPLPRSRSIFAGFCAVTLLLVLLALPTPSGAAGSQIHGRFLRHSAGNISMQLVIGTPTPQAIIVEEFLPAGTRVVSSSPPAQKIDSRSGVVKWLLTGIRPGKHILTLRVAPAEAARRPRAVLRYRSPNGGRIVELHIAP